MKKPTGMTTQRRKLVLRRETVTELTPRQLTKVGGGWTLDWPCQPWSQQQFGCVPPEDDTVA